MKTFLSIATVAGLLLPHSVALAESPTLPEGYREVGDDRVAALRELCQATAGTGLFSGAVLVADQGEVIYKEAFGPANREWNIPNTVDTKFRLASVSKQFCSLLVMQLVQEDRLSLEDKITDHLPSYRKDTGDRISLHHLLAHQSGLRDFTARMDYRTRISRLPADKDEFIKQFCSDDLLHEPGTLYSYCNAGYVILGRIIEKVTRRSFEQNLHERIFEPAGMTNSGYDRNRAILEKRATGYTRGPFGYQHADYLDMDSSPGASGSLYSTVDDLFRWDRALASDQLLERKYRDLMFTPNRDVPEVKAAGGRPHSRYGYGWQIYSRKHPVTGTRIKLIGHGGAINGFRAMEHRIVDRDAFVVVLCNQGDAPGRSTTVWKTVTTLANELAHVVTGQPYRMPAKAPVPPERRMYEKVKTEGVEDAIAWFREKGAKAAWGGANVAVAEQLIREGRVDDGLRLLALDVDLSPGKAWLLRKTARAHLEHGQPEQALQYARKGLELKPEDEALREIQRESEEETARLTAPPGRPDR